MTKQHTPTTSNAVEFSRDPVGFAKARGFVPPPSFAARSEWAQRELAARYLDDMGLDVDSDLSFVNVVALTAHMAELDAALTARVAELEAALTKLLGAVDRMRANAADGIADEIRAALKAAGVQS